MEDGGKEDTTKPKEVKISGKAGWLKKSSGKFFGTYKDRYIHLEHTEIVVYENEDMKTCLERLDLENYDKCHELRGPFKKKNRLILIRAPKSGNKVHDVKLQAQNQEEKEAWIKALSDGINRAKNKIFDEVKIEEGCSLEHVTRNRPKGNRGRRPPTRIHMKEVANVSSDGILRLDLDVPDSQANGTFHMGTEDSTPKEGTQSGTIPSDGPKNEPTSEEATPQKKILKPPMPPSKQNKPATPTEEAETTSDSGVDTGAPPTPCKPSSSQDDLSSDSSSVDKDFKPPKPPSKDKKPTLVDEKEATETPDGESDAKDKEETEDKTDKESEDKTDKESEKESEDKTDKQSEDKTEETTKVAQAEEQDKPTNTDNLPPTNILKPSVVMWDTPLVETSSEAEKVEVAKETQPTPEPSKKSTGPPAPPKKKPVKCPVKTEDSKEPSDVKKEEDKDKENESTSSELISVSDITETVAKAQSDTNTPLNSPEPPVEREAVPPASVSGEIVEHADVPVKVGKVEQEEEKSVDSGQHSAEESENGDVSITATSSTTTATTALLGSQTKLDEDISEADETDPPNAQSKSNSEQAPSADAGTPSSTEKDISGRDTAVVPSVRSKPQILSPRPLIPLKPKSKVRSASLGDLLADTPAPEKKPQAEGKASTTPAESDMKNLESEVTLEIKNTEDLLHTVSDQQTAEGENQNELLPEVLLATAMEKLKKAEEILCVAKSFKEKKAVDKESKRMSW